MEEFRVDPRVTTPEAQAKYIEQGKVLFKFNNTIAFTPENIAATKELFGDNLGEGAIVQPPLKGVCFDMVKIGKGVMIMPDCLMMSRGGITIDDGAMIAANVQLISNNHDLHDRMMGRSRCHDPAGCDGRRERCRRCRCGRDQGCPGKHYRCRQSRKNHQNNRT